MEKLKKTARVLDRFAQICLYIFAAAVLLIAITLGAFILIPGSWSHLRSIMSAFLISLGPLSVNLSEGFALDDRALLWYLISTILASLAADIFLLFGIIVFRNILRPMKGGMPFDTAVSKNLRKLGVLILVGGVVYYALKTGCTALFYRVFDVGAILNPQAVTGYKLNLSFDGAPLFAGLLLFFLSYIFKYGEELQNQSDETL